MRRSLIPVVTALLLAGVAGCSSSAPSSPSGAGNHPGSGSGSGPSGTVAAGGAPDGGSPGAGASGGSGSASSSGSGGSGSTPSSSAGVLLGADSLPSPAADHCRTKNLTAVARSTGQGRASVVITNKADGSCTVRGFPSPVFVGTSGRTELPLDWAGSVADTEKFTLAPGTSASAALTFTSLDECEAITGLDVVPPGESRPLTLAFTTGGGKKQAVRICDTGVRVKAFSPSR